MTTRAATPRYPGLDTMRAVASLAVVLTHAAFWAGFYDAGLLGAFTQRLEVGVSVFFVLSGFLLAHPWLTAARTGLPRDPVGRYATKRALRVLPVYWVTVVAALLVVRQNRELGLDRWVQNLTLVDLYREGQLPEGLSQMWSLVTEITFYAVLPLLMLLLLGRRATRLRSDRVLAILAVLSVGSIVWTAAATRGTLLELGPWTSQALPASFAWFAVGIAFAVVDVDRRHPVDARRSRLLDLLESTAAAPGACWLMAGAVLVVASTPLGGATGLVGRSASESVVRALAYTVVAALVVLPSIFGPTDSRYARWTSAPWLRHLGHISYSLFCCHVIVLWVLFDQLGLTIFDESFVLVTGLVLLVSLPISELLYRCVELPFLRLKDRGRRTPTDTTTDTATSAAS
ncbi:MAG: acyltransferase [Actinomycetales bacterium]|nr:MAG: acyltransferase [Actinomycetales bacterium]